jgi:hypothetical protein
MGRSYDPKSDVKLLTFAPSTLSDGRVVRAEVFSYAGGAPKLRVHVGNSIALKVDSTVLRSGALTRIINEAIFRWPKERE